MGDGAKEDQHSLQCSSNERDCRVEYVDLSLKFFNYIKKLLVLSEIFQFYLIERGAIFQNRTFFFDNKDKFYLEM